MKTSHVITQNFKKSGFLIPWLNEIDYFYSIIYYVFQRKRHIFIVKARLWNMQWLIRLSFDFSFVLAITLAVALTMAFESSVHTSMQLVHGILFSVKKPSSNSKIWTPVVFVKRGRQNKRSSSKECIFL